MKSRYAIAIAVALLPGLNTRRSQSDGEKCFRACLHICGDIGQQTPLHLRLRYGIVAMPG